MPEAENHALPGATNDTWRTWLMTGARRSPVDRRRVRGAYKGLKRMLLEGMANAEERPHAWRDFSGAMIRHAVDDAIRSLPSEDTHVVKLAYFGGFSNREIAEQVGLTEATVQRRLRRALATISDHIQHGRTLGRRAMYALTVWLSGRLLTDSAHHFAQAAVVTGAAAIIVTQPAAPPVAIQPGAHTPVTTTSAPALTVVPPLPSPTAAAVPSGVPGPVQKAIRSVQSPVAVPVKVPPLPPLPVRVPVKPAI